MGFWRATVRMAGWCGVLAMGAPGCDEQGPVELPEAPTPLVLDVLDVSNNGDGSDLSIQVGLTGEASSLLELRLFVIAGDDPPPVGSSDTYSVLDLTSFPAFVSPGANGVDHEGNPIREGVTYHVMLSAVSAAGPTVNSFLSPQIVLATTDIVTTLATVQGGTGGMETDLDGSIFMADFGTQLGGGTPGSRVFRITLDGQTSTFAQGLSGASGNALDGDGNLYQSNIAAGRISRITPTGVVSTFATGLSGPVGIALDGDTLYVANCSNDTISRVEPDGSTSLFSSSGLLACPNGLAIGPDDAFYVANFDNGNLVRISRDNEASVFATFNTNNLGHVTAWGERLYVALRGSHQLASVAMDGTITILAGNGVRGGRDGSALDASLSFPNDISVSADGTELYFNDVSPSTPGSNFLSPSVVRVLHLDQTGPGT